MSHTHSRLSVIALVIFSLAFVVTLLFPFYTYAVAETYTITYNSNGGTGGTAPTEQTKEHGIDLVLADNSSTLVRTGFTFAGWNTSPDGAGINYMAGATYATDANLTLYALWAEDSCTGTVYDSYGNEYGMVTSGNQCWLDRNLGATRVATAIDDAASYGYYYQWGRGADGHELAVNGVPTHGATSTLATSDTPGHNLFITTNNLPIDWRTPQKSALWQGVNGTNNVCPTGWRLPTSDELTTMVAQEGITGASNQGSVTAFNSALKLPAAGFRLHYSADMTNQGGHGIYWSSSPSSTESTALRFLASEVTQIAPVRAYGFNVRCTRDSHVATATTEENGTITPSVRTVGHGRTTTFTVTPAEGYAVDSVTGCNGTLTGSTYTTGAITADCTVSVTLSPIPTYSINIAVTSLDAGTVSCTANPVEHNHDTTCTASPADGYTFSGWSGDCTGDTCILVNVTSDKSVTANFTLNTYTVIASAGANGTISPTTQMVNHGETSTFTVTPESRYRASVTGCVGTLSGATYTTGAITNNCTVEATFTRIPSGGGGGSSAPKDKTPPPNKPTTPEKPSTPVTNKPSNTGVPTTPTLSSGVSITALIDILVALGIIPAEKADLARTLATQRAGQVAGATTALPSSFRFTQTIKLGDTHPEVKQLQQFLNSQGFTVAPTGPGSAGNETTFFGPATKSAVTKFQEAHRADILTPVGLTQGSGYFGPSTIQKANALLTL